MKIDQITALRSTLEQMETAQLDALLLEELRAEVPDGQRIRLISSILKDRDRNAVPRTDANIRQAWERYQRKNQPKQRHPKSRKSLLLKAASLILVLLTLMVLIPREAKAMHFFERFIAWTEDVFSLISPAEGENRAGDYSFRTENPGLQTVYDRVTELGVTVPVVPMWLPEGYELTECMLTDTPTKRYISAVFSNEHTKVIYQVVFYSNNISNEFYKDGTEIRVEERNGIKHSIIRNEELLVAVWNAENIECAIAIDCPEDDLVRILKSIYTVEEK